MQDELRSRWLRPALVGVVVVTIDQISKAWILRTLGPDEGTSIPLIGAWLSLTFVKNNGVAFGMFQGIPHFFTLTSIVISLAVSTFLFAMAYRNYILPRDPEIDDVLEPDEFADAEAGAGDE